MLVPAALFGVWAIRAAFNVRRSLLWQLIFAVCVAAVLVPSPLVEFRYYVVPFLLVVLHAHDVKQTPRDKLKPSRSTPCLDWQPWHSLVNVLGLAAFNALLLYVFAKRPFTWPDGSVARFMW